MLFINREGKLRSGWLIVLGIMTLLAGQFLFSIPIIFFSSTSFTGEGFVIELDFNELLLEEFLLIQSSGMIGSLIAIFLLWKYVIKQPVMKLGFQKPIKDLVFGLILGALSITFIFFILLLSGNVEMENAFSQPIFNEEIIYYLIFFIFVGVFEEVFFRGYVMNIMASRKNPKWLIYVTSSFVFSIMHGMNPNVSVIGLLNIFLVGLLFAYMFDQTKRLWLSIGYHITWNYFQGNVFGFAVSGTKAPTIYEVDTTTGHPLLTGGPFGLEGGLLSTLFILIGFFTTYLYIRLKKKIVSS